MIVETRLLQHTYCPQLLANGQRSRCAGEICMAWRWAGKNPAKGFCGLAGEPYELVNVVSGPPREEIEKMLTATAIYTPPVATAAEIAATKEG